MLLAGRALDRCGLRVAGLLLAAMGCAGAMVLPARDLITACAGLAVVGATSGAADVGLNAIAGRAEQVTGRPVITRAHGSFSSFVVVGSLGTGLASAVSLPVGVPFVAVALICTAVGGFVMMALPAGTGGHDGRGTRARDPATPARWRMLPFMLIGVLGALAFASENAQQSWSAVFAEQELGSGAGLSSVAPAVFAGAVAITRFSIGGLRAAHARTVLLGGAVTAAAGAALIAAAPSLSVAAVGLAATAAGTGVLYPTLVGVVSRNVAETHRGRATSVVATVSYLGFIVGPVYVGLWADAVGLRGAMVAVAALGAGLFVLTPVLLRLTGFDRPQPPPPPAEPAREGISPGRVSQD